MPGALSCISKAACGPAPSLPTAVGGCPGGLRTAGVACEVRIVDAIPLTSVLKTDRKLLRAQLRAESAS